MRSSSKSPRTSRASQASRASRAADASANARATYPHEEFDKPAGEGWRAKAYTIIFEADTPSGRLFDLLLIGAILISVLVVMLDSVATISSRIGPLLHALEWFFTGLFTLEYAVRLWCVRRPVRYARSFYGLVDLIAILPAYLKLFLPGWHFLLDVRILRLLRAFRILRLNAYVEEYSELGHALRASRRKILIFLSVVLMVVILLGTAIYVAEGPENGFTSIPTSIYWAITAVTTVGFGDLAPKTNLGRTIASVIMLLGWGILAVPTGIISSEMASQRFHRLRATTRTCHECLTEGHEASATFCKDCGAELPPYQSA